MAFMHNANTLPFKIPGSLPVDNAAWFSFGTFSLQVWDFISDINLSIEIFRDGNFLSNGLIAISGLGCVIFILIPYITNLIIAGRIKKRIKYNDVAKAWFTDYSFIFVLLVCFSGGSYPSLALVSSNAFGLKILSSGITLYELKLLSKIKVFSTIILENVPQLFFQFLYVYATGGKPSDNTILAFTASLLSVTAAILGYCIDKDEEDTKVLQYYLSTQCYNRGNNQSLDEILLNIWEDSDLFSDDGNVNDIVINNDHNDGDDGQASEQNSTSPRTRRKEAKTVKNGMTLKEKEKFILNKGKTLQLSIEISEIFGIPTKNIEIGQSMTTKYGIMTRVVHFIYDSDLAEMEEELLLQQNEEEKNNINNKIYVSPIFYVEQLYLACKDEINQVFRQHFEINTDYETRYVKSLQSKKKKLVDTTLKTISTESNNDLKNTNKSLIKKIVSNNNIFSNILINNNDNHIDDDFDIIDKLEKWMKQRNMDYDKISDRKKFFKHFIDDDDDNDDDNDNDNDDKEHKLIGLKKPTVLEEITTQSIDTDNIDNKNIKKKEKKNFINMIKFKKKKSKDKDYKSIKQKDTNYNENKVEIQMTSQINNNNTDDDNNNKLNTKVTKHKILPSMSNDDINNNKIKATETMLNELQFKDKDQVSIDSIDDVVYDIIDEQDIN